MLIESLRRVKSRNEIACLEVACSWAGKAHRRMQDAIETGRTEMASYEPARLDTLRELVAELPGWRPRGFDGGLMAMFVAGRRTAMPHGFVRGQTVVNGDVLVSGCSLEVDGYLSELERTMIVGEPIPAQRRAFEAMVALQSCALLALKPGRAAAEVELDVLRAAEDLGVKDRLRHHVGHSIGLEPHEAPFLDRGEEAVLEPGMVFTVEPGLYYPEMGGFRHSDTVLITGSGCRILTDYPRDLESLVIAIR
jgi:Xaa-Pro aminopeptidase